MNKEFFISVFSASSLVLLSILLIVIINRIVIFFIEWKKKRKKTLSVRKRNETFLMSQNSNALSRVY
jgi:hypothetical protein